MVTMELTTGETNNTIVYSNLIAPVLGKWEPYSLPGGALYCVTVYLNPDKNWSIGASPGCYDIQTVVLHELGHVLGVAHCHEENEVCYNSTCELNVMNRLTSPNSVRTTFQYYDTTSYKVIYS